MNVIIYVIIMSGIIIASSFIEAAEEREHEELSQFGTTTRAVPALADEIIQTMALELLQTRPKITRTELFAHYRSPTGGSTYSLDILNRVYETLQQCKKQAIEQARLNFLQEVNKAGTTELEVIKHGTMGIPKLEEALERYFRMLGQLGVKP